MRNFIGSFLIAFAAFITFLRSMIFFALTVGIVMGVLMMTMFCLFELFHHIAPNHDYPMAITLFKKPIWDIVIVVIGGATMWMGITKMFEEDKEERKTKNKEYLF